MQFQYYICLSTDKLQLICNSKSLKSLRSSLVQHSESVQESWSLQWWYKKGILAAVIIISGGHAFLKCTYHIMRILLATCVSKWKLSYWNIEKKSEKNLGYFSVLDPHKHSDIVHFHMLNCKGEDLKFQRPIYLPPNLACLFPLQWNFYCYLLLSIIISSNFSPVFLTFTCTRCFSHSKLLQGMPALNWNI